VRPGLVGFEDRVLGHVAQDVREKVGDFVVRRADGVFAYQLAVVVDDIAMGMTEVLRGDDLTVSTPRQLLLYEALGAVPPRFTHVPLVLGPSGERLSKRDGPVSVAALVERGVSPERICAVLGRMCGLEGATAREWVGRFDLGRLPPGAPRFDPQALLDSRDANAVTTDDAAAGPSGLGLAQGPASAH
jgi:glutamyl-tRNA synthetase